MGRRDSPLQGGAETVTPLSVWLEHSQTNCKLSPKKQRGCARDQADRAAIVEMKKNELEDSTRHKIVD